MTKGSVDPGVHPSRNTVDDERQHPPKPRRQKENARKGKASKPKEQAAHTVGNDTDQSSSNSEEVPRMAPLVEEPLRDDEGNACLLTTSHYIVSGSVGSHPSAMRPFHIAFDTGSGYNVIRLRDLPSDWERYRIPNAKMPPLGDANCDPLRLMGKVAL